MARLALAICSVLALLLIAAMLPVAGTGGGSVRLHGQTVVKRPAWPPWAHEQVAAAAAPATTQTTDHALSALQSGEHLQTMARVTPGKAGTRAGLPRLQQAPLHFTVLPLLGVDGAVPTPPPRAA